MVTSGNKDAIEEGKLMRLFPLYECAEQANDYVRSGSTVYQQFKCASCGAKQTMSVPNAFYMCGRCEECDEITDIAANGCNYMLVTGKPSD